MDFNKYCKHCGRKVIEIEPTNNMRTYTCICTNALLQRNDVIAGFTKDARIKQLKAMHELMMEANDENIYMAWIYLMPDCPSEEDFESIAINDTQYNECFDKFVRLIAKDGNRY